MVVQNFAISRIDFDILLTILCAILKIFLMITDEYCKNESVFWSVIIQFDNLHKENHEMLQRELGILKAYT